MSDLRSLNKQEFLNFPHKTLFQSAFAAHISKMEKVLRDFAFETGIHIMAAFAVDEEGKGNTMSAVIIGAYRDTALLMTDRILQRLEVMDRVITTNEAQKN